MRAQDLLGHQADFVRRYSGPLDDPDVKMMHACFASAFTSMKKRAGERTENLSVIMNNLPPVVRDAPDSLSHFAEIGLPILVTEEMVDLISWVADDMSDTDEVEMGLMPSPAGFVRLEKPLILDDGSDHPPVHIDWLVWGPSYAKGPKAIAYAGFNDSSKPDSITRDWFETASKTREALLDKSGITQAHGPFVFTFLAAMYNGEKVGPRDHGPMAGRPRAVEHRRSGDDATLMEFTAWGLPAVNRWLYALWIVMNQEIADVREEHPPRAAARQAMRRKLPPMITVIRLRRPPSHRAEGESHVEWQHHWYVRAHPRWQACGPGRQERKLIMIGPHVKGNLDAPLRQTKKVYRVER